MTTQDPPAPEGTALALIDAGMALFGTKGFAATSTRELAERAGTNVASISYHFGGKEALRRACAEEFVRRLRAAIGTLPDPDALSPDAAREAMKAILRAMVLRVLADAKSRPMVNFMVREITENTEISAAFYDTFLAHMHQRICRLWSIATGEPAEDGATKLRVFSVFGQLLYFRLGADFVSRRMGWTGLGPREAEEIYQTLAGNLDAMLAQARRAAP